MTMTTIDTAAGAPRVAMISGASRGIGAAIAQELLSHGWAVSLGCRRSEEVVLDASLPVIACRYDALDPSTDETWIDQTLARFARLDAVVHNAGVMNPLSVLEASDEDFDATFDVNVKAPMRLTRKLWPHLVASGEGRIVTLASLSAKRVKAERSSLYSMSKFAVLALAHGLRKCGEPHGIRSTAICPGFVATDMGTALTQLAPERMTQPEDLARIVRTVLELPSSASISEIPVNWTVEDAY
ncbi:SDR family NAD(P)-dependent oxidoreductase [Halotalea alkalilenta]|uniref:SDR family NAD(P)-dependent oxidoreductase n=1 Tax=Halotalea alkalilenta TaxID=376489 RepID=UPI000A4893C9|nr:SDR family NAD(P)-dependent oxidoreductase [Halotalea alkalilenta]